MGFTENKKHTEYYSPYCFNAACKPRAVRAGSTTGSMEVWVVIGCQPRVPAVLFLKLSSACRDLSQWTELLSCPRDGLVVGGGGHL